MFLQKIARSPNASAMNMAFTKHITNALMQIREEKFKQKVLFLGSYKMVGSQSLR
jgi:hypothetical protein